MRFKHIYNNMYTNLIKSLIFMLIVMLASFGILKSVVMVKYYNTKYKSVKEVIDTKIYKINAVNGAKVVESNYDEETAKEVLQFLNNENDFYYFAKQTLVLSDFEGSENIGLEISESPKGKSLMDSVYSINNNFFNINKIELEQGRFFTEEELKVNIHSNKNNKVPVIMGYEYEKYFNIGDQVSIFNIDENVSVEIIGFMKENTSVIDYNKMIGNAEINIDNKVIAPYGITGTYSENLKKIFWGKGILKMDFDIPMEDINNRLNTISDYILTKMDVKVGFSDINKTVNEEYQYRLSIIIIRMISTLVICILGITTLGIISLMSIDKRKKEFGIHILSGSTKLDLYKSIVIEQVILTVIPFISVWVYLKGVVGLGINYSITIISLLILTAVIGIITFISIVKIQSISISTLIKGDD